MTAALVEVRGVTRRFGPVTALDAVDVDIRENEFFALLGPSGCGKTTLLRILAGLERPDAGTVTLDGADLLAMPVHRRPVNLMFQSYALFPHLTVAKNIGYGLARDKVPKAEIRRRVSEVLDVVGLTGLGHRKPAQLSGGQRQRVALARAVVKRPRLLLLDEPLAALDRKMRSQMQTELKRLQHEVGITFVIVTHDQEEAMSMADRIAVMNGGRIEQLDSPTELYERPRTRFVADFIGSTNLFDAVAADGTASAGSLRPENVALVETPDEVPAGRTAAAGAIRDIQFFGGVSHVMIDAPGYERPLVAAAVGATQYTPGQRVVAHWDPNDVVPVAVAAVVGPEDAEATDNTGAEPRS